jgi:hypothetical protein
MRSDPPWYGSYGAGIAALREDFLWECSRLRGDSSLTQKQRQDAKEKLRREHCRALADEWKVVSAQMRSNAGGHTSSELFRRSYSSD